MTEPGMSLKRRMKGFTLIELMVVVSIIALLMSILLPSLQQAREQAKRVTCGANLHSIGQAVGSCSAENNGYGPAWDDGDSRSGEPVSPYPMLTWIDILFDLDYLGDVKVGLCPSDRRDEEPMVDRGVRWDFSFVDNFGVNEAVKPGVRGSFAINALMNWNNPRDKFNDAGRQLYAVDGWWTWFGGINAQWLMFRKLTGRTPPPTTYPHWQGTMVGWRHGRDFLINQLFVDGHVSTLRPRVPRIPQDLQKTVDTVQSFTWLPAELPHRFDFGNYHGEIENWTDRQTAFVHDGYDQPTSWPEELHPGWRTNNRAWRKLPANPADRN